MKSLITAIILTAMSAWGVVTSDVITCRIQVNSRTRSTILSLPLTELGGDANMVELNKVVLTDNLEDDTFLFASVGNATHAWKLTNGAWVKFTAVDGFNHTSDTSAVNALQRGVAFWVERAGDAEAIEKPFYIYGLVGARAQLRQNIESAVESGNKIIPAYTRIGNPNPEDRDLNDLSWSGCNEKDVIALVDSKSPQGFFECMYNPAEEKWGVKETYRDGKVLKQRWDYSRTKLLAGQGFWYVRKTVGAASVGF